MSPRGARGNRILRRIGFVAGSVRMEGRTRRGERAGAGGEGTNENEAAEGGGLVWGNCLSSCDMPRGGELTFGESSDLQRRWKFFRHDVEYYLRIPSQRRRKGR